MEINLKRPLIIFDVESTGLNIVRDRIIELSYVKVFPDGSESQGTYRFNPGIPIPAQSVAVHHITDDDVKDCPTFKQKAAEIAQLFAGCDIAGFNSNHFDIPILAQELAVAGQEFDFNQCKFIDVQNIFHKMERRDLAAACLFYCGVEMQDHHSSMADARTTLNVLKAQLDRYAGSEQVKNDVEALSAFSSYNNNVDLAGRVVYEIRPNGERVEVINFGKYKGQPLDEVVSKDKGYVGWIQSSDFSEDTKRVFREAAQDLKEKEKQSQMQHGLEALKIKFNGK